MKAVLALVFAWHLAAAVDPQTQAALDRVSADSLRGNLSFLASDLLEGRDTPSRGLDLAAEFIAAQFRRAGLEPVFQTADFTQVVPDMTGFHLTLGELTVQENVDIRSAAALDLTNAHIVKVADAKPPSLSGKVALIELPDTRGALNAVRRQNPAAILLYAIGAPPHRSPQLQEGRPNRIPTITVSDLDAEELLANLPDGDAPITLSIHAKAPILKPVKLHNVTALLKGSDPVLSSTYILLTAHYDHIGMNPEGEGDRIYNGANDDGSGTVSVIEIANALAAMKQRPRRSILFMTFFGEEPGLLGSRYYAKHPLFPLDHTVAQINLEQLGRTDDNSGPRVASATFTGFDFSDLPAIFRNAGKSTGIKVEGSEADDKYFARSDNQSLADAGIPAHTIVVSVEFPDYHKVGDEWQKIDYNNMAKVDRMIALGVITLADRDAPPKWSESNPKAIKYLNAWKSLHPETVR